MEDTDMHKRIEEKLDIFGLRTLLVRNYFEIPYGVNFLAELQAH